MEPTAKALLHHLLADLARRRDAVVDVVQRVSPAVVYIGTEQVVEQRFRGGLDPFLEEFFGGRGERRQQTVQGLGSGVIIDASGVIVTNEHVIRGASAIHVVLADGRQLDAEVSGSDADNDLAVLRVGSKTPLPTAKLGTSADLMIGEKVIAIGSPFGLKKTVTVGVVSATGRSVKADNRVFNDFVQTDASINPGNSGGPLLNIDGEIIGINSAIFASAQGIGFAIPADKVRRIVTELTQYGKVRPAWVGLETQQLTPGLARNLGWDRSYGVLIANVDPGSPAEKAGLQRGDIISDVSGAQVEDVEDFDVRMKGYTAKASFGLNVFRDGQLRQVTVTPVEFPTRLAERLAWDRLGIRVKGSGGGMIISQVRPGSAASRAGLEPGDVILRLNNQPMASLEVFREGILSSRSTKSVLLLVRRGRAGYYLTLPF
ncbi:MAG: trypsin-like peptidase domain-containing protein [Myxococcaceae bacterium]